MAQDQIEATAGGWRAVISVPNTGAVNEHLAYLLLIKQLSAAVEDLTHKDPDTGKAKALAALVTKIDAYYATRLPQVIITLE